MKMNCWIYKSRRKDEMYLYLANKDDFSALPADLLQHFGPTEYVMQLELHPQRKLARANVHTVMQCLKQDGYYLQMPPKLIPQLYHGNLD